MKLTIEEIKKSKNSYTWNTIVKNDIVINPESIIGYSNITKATHHFGDETISNDVIKQLKKEQLRVYTIDHRFLVAECYEMSLLLSNGKKVALHSYQEENLKQFYTELTAYMSQQRSDIKFTNITHIIDDSDMFCSDRLIRESIFSLSLNNILSLNNNESLVIHTTGGVVRFNFASKDHKNQAFDDLSSCFEQKTSFGL